MVNKFDKELNNYFNIPAIKLLKVLIADRFKFQQQEFNLKALVIKNMENDFSNYYKSKTNEKNPEFKCSVVEKKNNILTEKIYFNESSFEKKNIEKNIEGKFFNIEERSELYETFIYIKKLNTNDIANQIGMKEENVNVIVQILCVKPYESYEFGNPALVTKDEKQEIQIQIIFEKSRSIIKNPLGEKLEESEVWFNYLDKIKNSKEKPFSIDYAQNIVSYSFPLKIIV